jgi:hypothetical protein
MRTFARCVEANVRSAAATTDSVIAALEAENEELRERIYELETRLDEARLVRLVPA